MGVGGPALPAPDAAVLLEMSLMTQPSSGITAPCRGAKAQVFPLAVGPLEWPFLQQNSLVELSGPSLSLHCGQASHLAPSCLPPPFLSTGVDPGSPERSMGTPDGMGIK